MRLNEFVEPAEDQALAASIIAVSNHLQQQVETGEIDKDNYTVDNLLTLFQSNDIIIDVQDLYNMIKQPLLKGIISNIQGDKVVFKGHIPPSSGRRDPSCPPVSAGTLRRTSSTLMGS